MKNGLLNFLRKSNNSSGTWQSQNWQYRENYQNLYIDLIKVHYAYLIPFFIAFDNSTETVTTVTEFKIKKIKIFGSNVIRNENQLIQSYLYNANPIYESETIITSPNNCFTISNPHPNKTMFHFKHGTVQLTYFLGEGVYEIYLKFNNNSEFKSEPFTAISFCKEQIVYTKDNTYLSNFVKIDNNSGTVYITIPNPNTFIQFYINNNEFGNILRTYNSGQSQFVLTFDNTQPFNLSFKCWTPYCVEFDSNVITSDNTAIQISEPTLTDVCAGDTINGTVMIENINSYPIVDLTIQIGFSNVSAIDLVVNLAIAEIKQFSFTIPTLSTMAGVYLVTFIGMPVDPTPVNVYYPAKKASYCQILNVGDRIYPIKGLPIVASTLLYEGTATLKVYDNYIQCETAGTVYKIRFNDNSNNYYTIFGTEKQLGYDKILHGRLGNHAFLTSRSGYTTQKTYIPNHDKGARKIINLDNTNEYTIAINNNDGSENYLT